MLHDTADIRHDVGADKSLKRRDILAKRPEHKSAENLDAQFARRVFFRVAVRRHAALAANAAAECNAGQLAAQIIGPVVIDAGDFFRLATILMTQDRAAMRAAVFEGMDRAFGVAGDDNRHVAEMGRAVGVRLRQFRFQAQEAPGVAAKDPLHFLRIEIRVRINPVRYPRQRVSGQSVMFIPVLRRNTRRRAYCSFTLAALMTLVQRSTSSRM